MADSLVVALRRSKAIVIGLTLLTLGVSASAQERLPADITPVDQPDGVTRYERQQQGPPSWWREFWEQFSLTSSKRPFEKSVAFLAGVSEYEHISQQLEYVTTDLRELRNYLLSKGGFDTVYVADGGTASRREVSLGFREGDAMRRGRRRGRRW